MYTENLKLWENTPGECQLEPEFIYYKPDNKTSDISMIMLPGGAYGGWSLREGEQYAEYFAERGISSFVLKYRVAPAHHFPLPLLDARRAIRYVRYYAEKFGIDKNKVVVVGSSAGGHLAALVSTYTDPIDFEGTDIIDEQDFVPNAQVLCYAVVSLADKNYTHIESGDNLIGNSFEHTQDLLSRIKLSPNLLVSKNTPPAFIWHTFQDQAVSVKNSLEYLSALKDYDIRSELHVFPDGLHGLALGIDGDTKAHRHGAQWKDLLFKWFDYIWE